VKQTADGWMPLSPRMLLCLLRRSSLLQTVCVETAWRRLDVQSYRLASCPGAVVTAETGSGTAPSGAGDHAATPTVPLCPLLRPRVRLDTCWPRGWLRALLHGGSGRPDRAAALVGL